MTPRPVSITLDDVRNLTVLETVRANRLAGIRPSDSARLTVALEDPEAADPADVEQAFTWLYACAFELHLRDEPGLTWAEAQTWRLELDTTPLDDVDDEAEALVAAALVSGLPPHEAGELRIRELAAYQSAAERARTG